MDVLDPYGKPVLDPQTGEHRFIGTASGGEIAFAILAKAIVDHG